MKKEFAVIGLGRFGSSVCKELFRLGHDVLAIDQDEEKVQDVLTIATHTAIANATDEKALQSLGIRNFEYVVVAIGDDIQSSILCTLLLKELGVKKVWAKAQSYYHQRVLEKIGADRVVRPERDMGMRMAHHLVSENIVDYIELSSEYSILELKATDKLHQRSLIDLDIRAKYGCTVLGIKKMDELNISPKPTDHVEKGDILIVLGHNRDLKKFEDTGM
ncbi:potassium channel family protein [Alkalihalobacillus trypoxylicola]|uniref:Potassium transporter Trk n=1 Tax=Alkalihalobacillus trypoxylicola TaxID=519424 RepID=A0A161PHJ2_9BACI|nr:TrkA family potassium uptake protein [Alkalihalobacillus trypoxylicola]KYG32344.1 potassium transporter Trk [Alkalihalobacillus trypoxylicola]GAF64035.1 potassium transport system subunit KtrA [Bacillus sp. TS-2]